MTTQARLIAALIALAAWGASMSVCAWWFYGAGRDSEIAKQSEIKTAIEQTQEKAETGAANAIAKSAAENTKVVTRVQTVTREVPVYRSAGCVHDVRVFNDLNSQLQGTSPANGSLPEGSGGTP